MNSSSDAESKWIYLLSRYFHIIKRFRRYKRKHRAWGRKKGLWQYYIDRMWTGMESFGYTCTEYKERMPTRKYICGDATFDKIDIYKMVREEEHSIGSNELILF